MRFVGEVLGEVSPGPRNDDDGGVEPRVRPLDIGSVGAEEYSGRGVGSGTDMLDRRLGVSLLRGT